ncbi:hypothetical protein HanRHA438_Chr10g0444451 [Helianthus annuus]|nr:hypothetical protein HanRHA438_Chr10g0444451 [Helianthus annuus]
MAWMVFGDGGVTENGDGVYGGVTWGLRWCVQSCGARFLMATMIMDVDVSDSGGGGLRLCGGDTRRWRSGWRPARWPVAVRTV